MADGYAQDMPGTLLLFGATTLTADFDGDGQQETARVTLLEPGRLLVRFSDPAARSPGVIVDLTDQLRDCDEGSVRVAVEEGRWPTVAVTYTASLCTYTETAQVAWRDGTAWLDGWSWTGMAVGEIWQRQGERLVLIETR